MTRLLTLWTFAVLIGQIGSQVSPVAPSVGHFDVSPPQPDMRILHSAFQSGRFYFLFTRDGRSELVATDTDGQEIARKATNNPAIHIRGRCPSPGMLAERPARDGGTIIEEYASDLTFQRTFAVKGGFIGGLCEAGNVAGLSQGNVVSVDANTGSIKSSELAAAGDDPLIAAPADLSSFVIVRQFTGMLQHRNTPSTDDSCRNGAYPIPPSSSAGSLLQAKVSIWSTT